MNSATDWEVIIVTNRYLSTKCMKSYILLSKMYDWEMCMWKMKDDSRRYLLTRTVGHKSHEPFFNVFLMEAGVMTFVTHCTSSDWGLGREIGRRTRWPLTVSHDTLSAPGTKQRHHTKPGSFKGSNKSPQRIFAAALTKDTTAPELHRGEPKVLSVHSI